MKKTPHKKIFLILLLLDEKEYRSIVLWLEDQKIRHYKIEEREGLRNIDSDSWKEAYDTYQKDLVSPINSGDPNEQLNWLLSYAVRLEYGDNGNPKYLFIYMSITPYCNILVTETKN